MTTHRKTTLHQSVLLAAISLSALTSCKEDDTKDEHELRAARERITELEARIDEFTKERTRALEPPGEEQILAVAKEIASRTIGYSQPNLSVVDEGNVLEVESVKIVGSSRDGIYCDVVADVYVRWLPRFQRIDKIKDAGFRRWFRFPNYRWEHKLDQSWVAQRRQATHTTFSGLEMRFQKFDTGWRLLKTNAQ